MSLSNQAKLQDKVTIVTGAGTRGPAVGTGQAIAQLFARAGAKVWGVDLNLDNAAVTRQAITDEGGTAAVY
ncbi:MAG: hypothetical protein KF832_04065 [Caldilineaceae bacterium]|nr:hypothetical protein [Caldilineaceae bacterium]